MRVPSLWTQTPYDAQVFAEPGCGARAGHAWIASLNRVVWRQLCAESAASASLFVPQAARCPAAVHVIGPRRGRVLGATPSRGVPPDRMLPHAVGHAPNIGWDFPLECCLRADQPGSLGRPRVEGSQPITSWCLQMWMSERSTR